MFKVGFCTGVFDQFHEGHKYFLSKCLGHCDWLVVAINSDASAKRLKGPTRPVDDWWTRAIRVCKYLEVFGSVFPFEGRELSLINEIRPEVFFLDSEKPRITIVGGPSVVYIPRLAGASTTEILRERSERRADGGLARRRGAPRARADRVEPPEGDKRGPQPKRKTRS